MMVLKDLINVRADMRIILMSATLDANLFSEYFYDAPVIYIPGKDRKNLLTMELFH